ncbi:uncharacterized protein LOC111242884 isoform X2 [Varroa destructor]|uniref:Uncharacterized protein n=1 Tax=Varroa destructor TaxID=109461 RepID=A0A7M7J3K7_VARDE|nr:uncharacterized protein LOC111242884 isoform X2 [Varroa destructor]
MQEAILLLLGLLGTSDEQHLIPVDVVHSEKPHQFQLTSAAAKDPMFIHRVMQPQRALPVTYSHDPDVITVAESSSIEDKYGQDPIAAKLEKQETAEVSAIGVRNRREVPTQESQDRPDYDHKDSSSGNVEDDGSPADGFGYDHNDKAKLEEEVVSAERAVAKYDKMEFEKTVGSDDGSYGQKGVDGVYGSETDAAYKNGHEDSYGAVSGDGTDKDSGTSSVSENNYAVNADDNGDPGDRGDERDMNASDNDHRYGNTDDSGYESSDRHNPASDNDYESKGSDSGGGKDENGNDTGNNPSKNPSDTSGSEASGDAGNDVGRYDATTDDNYGDFEKSDYSNERNKGFSEARGDGNEKNQGYENPDEGRRNYGENDNYAEWSSSDKPVNREESYSRSLDFHEKPKPKLKPYREILEEEDRKNEGASSERTDDGYDGKTEGFDGNYKAEGFNGDEVTGGSDEDNGGSEGRSEADGNQETAPDGYSEAVRTHVEASYSEAGEINEATDRPKSNEEKYAALDGPDYESQRGTDYYDRNEDKTDGQVSAGIETVQESPTVIKTIIIPRAPYRKGSTSYKNDSGEPSQLQRRQKRDTTQDSLPTSRVKELIAQQKSAIYFTSTPFQLRGNNESGMRIMPSSYDGIVTSSGVIDDNAPQRKINSTSKSATRAVNYSSEEGLIPFKQTALENSYLARTRRELGPASPGMDFADQRFLIGGFKPMFPVDDPGEGPYDLKDGREPSNRMGEALDILPRGDFGRGDDDGGGDRLKAESISPATLDHNTNSPANYNAPYGPAPVPTRAPYANLPQILHYPLPAFRGRLELRGASSPSNPSLSDTSLPLSSSSLQSDNPALPLSLKQVSPASFSDEPTGTTVTDVPPIRVTMGRNRGTRYKREYTRNLQKRDIHQHTYGKHNSRKTHKATTPSRPVYRKQFYWAPVGTVTQHQQSQLAKPPRRARRSTAGAKIYSVEVFQPKKTLFHTQNVSSLKVDSTEPKMFSDGKNVPKTIARSKSSAYRKKKFYRSSESDENCRLSAEESRIQSSAVASPRSKVVDLKVSVSMKSTSTKGSRKRPNSATESIITAGTSNEGAMWGLQLAKKKASDKKQSKIMIINNGEVQMKAPLFIAAPTPKPVKGILQRLGFSRTMPAKGFEKQIASDILGSLENKEQMIFYPDETEHSAGKDEMQDKPYRRKRHSRKKYRTNRFQPTHHRDDDSREKFRPMFDGNGEEPWNPIEITARTKPVKLLVLPSSRKEPEKQANERLEIIYKYPRGSRQVYREYRPSHSNGRVKERIVVYRNSFSDHVVAFPGKHDQKHDINTDKIFMKRSEDPKIKIIALRKEDLAPQRPTSDPGRFNISTPYDMKKGFVILGKPLDGGGPMGAGRLVRKARLNGRTVDLVKKPESGFAEITVSSMIRVNGD